MTLLLDVNVLVAFAWPNHVHHGRARRWFARRQEPWATCPATEMGFVRLSANPAVVDPALSPAEAADVVAELRTMPDHQFWPDGTTVSDVDWTAVTTFRQVPDAHLVALARRRGGRVATLDRRLVDRSGDATAVLVV